MIDDHTHQHHQIKKGVQKQHKTDPIDCLKKEKSHVRLKEEDIFSTRETLSVNNWITYQKTYQLQSWSSAAGDLSPSQLFFVGHDISSCSEKRDVYRGCTSSGIKRSSSCMIRAFLDHKRTCCCLMMKN